MRWNTPKHRDRRVRQKFAFWPTQMDNNVLDSSIIVWFEWYWVRETYDSFYGRWVPVEWCSEEPTDEQVS